LGLPRIPLCINENVMNPHLQSIALLLLATTLEVSGDALVRVGIYKHTGFAHFGFMLIGAIFLFGYGYSLNKAPLEFGQVAGLYIATLFVVWQVVNFVAFRTLPSLPILVGGALIIAGGLLVTFWKPLS
jgi:small multidrug resistance family-3 protein